MRIKELLSTETLIAALLCLALWLPLGCSLQIGPQGFNANFGQSSISTCGPIVEGEDRQEDCTVITGAAVSQQAGSMIGGVLAGALRMLGLSYGVPAAPADTE